MEKFSEHKSIKGTGLQKGQTYYGEWSGYTLKVWLPISQRWSEYPMSIGIKGTCLCLIKVDIDGQVYVAN